MKTLSLHYTNNEVNINIGQNYINKNWDFLDLHYHYFVITDQNVHRLYHQCIDSIPNLKGIICLVPGEISKGLAAYQRVITIMQETKITKDDRIIAIGGGVITDLAGFVAGTYKRGISHINIPTTLIGMVDASIGGKCGLNLNDIKNQIGLINHPLSVYIDTMWLETNETQEFKNGWAEIIKIATIASNSLFSTIENLSKEDYFNLDVLYKIIIKAVTIKAKITQKDEYDCNKRRLLNFGHTIGHIIESHTNFEIPHGQAVAMGMIAETTSEGIRNQLIQILSSFDLLTQPIPEIDYTQKLYSDKKVSQNKITLVNFTSVGHGKIRKYRLEDLKNEQFWQKY